MATKKTEKRTALELKLMDENAQLKADLLNLKSMQDGYIQIIADLKEAIQGLGKKHYGKPFKSISIHWRDYKLLPDEEIKNEN